jgi:hypothetical protein
MKYTIILIIIIIIIIIILNKHQNINEKYVNMSDEDTVNKVFNNCGNRKGKVQFERIKVMGNINNKSKAQFLLDLAYPIGSYYVQYESVADNNSIRAFPSNRSPAQLFGGDWQEQWKYESIFFRTSGSLADENRVDGFQNYATQRMKGDTTYSQADYNLKGLGNSGIFDAYTIEIGTDNGRSNDQVTHVKFDLSGYYNDDKEKEMFRNKEYEKGLEKEGKVVEPNKMVFISDLETRPRNRLIKVWKRVLRDASGNLPKPLEKGYQYTKYDHNYYEGPEQHRYFPTPIPGIANDYYGINGFEKAMEFCNKEESCKHISFKAGTWRYGKNNETPFYSYIFGNVPGGSIGGAESPNDKIWTKRESGVTRINEKSD